VEILLNKLTMNFTVTTFVNPNLFLNLDPEKASEYLPIEDAT
jgi:hypothetical protein